MSNAFISSEKNDREKKPTTTALSQDNFFKFCVLVEITQKAKIKKKN